MNRSSFQSEVVKKKKKMSGSDQQSTLCEVILTYDHNFPSPVPTNMFCGGVNKVRFSEGLRKDGLSHPHNMMYDHRHSSPSDDIKWFECDHCPFKAKTKPKLQAHFTAKHANPEDLKWFECTHCPYRAKFRYHLARHISRRHPAPEDLTWFECEQCQYKTLRKDYLNCHIMRKHTSPDLIKWFECAHCPYRAKFRYHLVRHISRKHSASGDL